MNEMNIFHPKVPIGRQAHSYAQKLASSWANFRYESTYRSRLAVYSFHEYLEMIGIRTNLEQEDHFNPSLERLFDIASVTVSNVGRIECFLVSPDETTIDFSLKLIDDDLIACVAVRLDKDLNWLEILGVFPASSEIINGELEQLPVSALKPPDVLIDYLPDSVFENTLANSLPQNNSSHKNLVDLSQWFKGVFDEVWQPVKMLLGLQEVETYDFKPGAVSSFQTASAGLCEESPAEVDRGTLIDLGKDRGQVILRLSIQNQNDEELYVLVEVRPLVLEDLLPANLELAVIVGEEVLKNKLEEPGKCLQVEPDCFKYGDRFDIQLSIDGVRIVRSFIFSLENAESTSNEKA